MGAGAVRRTRREAGKCPDCSSPCFSSLPVTSLPFLGPRSSSMQPHPPRARAEQRREWAMVKQVDNNQGIDYNLWEFVACPWCILNNF